MLGPVFRAYQPAPGRLVAVKQFRLGLSPDDSQRFAASLDRIVAADLSHAGIATPIAAGLADASPYLALDFVAAESFDVVIRESGPGQPREVVSFARQLAGALDAAAASSVVHGALHPRDVLMASDDVRMTGLGIAQALESVGMAAPIRRPYAAPERTAGAPWDRRADIFSLGALAYEMLVGRRVLATGSESAESLPQIDGADLDRLRVVFAKALADKAANRFDTAMDFADALERALTPVARGKSNGRRRRTADTPQATPAFELPLDIPLDTPPLGDATGPHVEISAIDAAFPLSTNSDAAGADLALQQARSSPPDFANLDTRLDEFDDAQMPELALHAIEQAQAEKPSSRSPQGEPTLQLDALDAATERMAAARDGVAHSLAVDTEAISLTVPPLSEEADAGVPLDAIEQALAADAPVAETTRRDGDPDDLRASGTASGPPETRHDVAALDAALDLQSSEATADLDLGLVRTELPKMAAPFSVIDEALSNADQARASNQPVVDVSAHEVVSASDVAADVSEAVNMSAEDAPSAPSVEAADASHLASSEPVVFHDVDEPMLDVSAADDEGDAVAPWDDEHGHQREPREEDTRWADESPGLAVDAALDAISARTSALTPPETADSQLPLAVSNEPTETPDEESEPVPAFVRSLSLGQEPAASSGNRPIVLGVVLGLLVGFAFGYGIGQWRTGSAGQTAASAPETAPQTASASPTARESARVAEPPASSPATSAVSAQSPAASATTVPPAPASAPPAATPPAPATPGRAPGRGAAATASGATPQSTGRAEPAAASARPNDVGRLVVRTTPGGANVTIDGKDAGLTPITTTLRPGFHTVRLSHQGYVTAQRRVRITSQPAQPIDLELVARPAREVAATPAAPERASGSLVLDSRPTGARVYVDGALVGTTPMQIDAITGGDHAVRFEMDGFGPWSSTAKVTAGAKTRVSGSLER